MNKKRSVLFMATVCLSLWAIQPAQAGRPVLNEHASAQPPTVPTGSLNIKTTTTDNHITQILGSVNSPRGAVKKIGIIRRIGGRVAWSPKGDLIAIDKKGPDNYHDLYLITPDGGHEECLTCETGGVLSHGHNGQPAWHPSGKYLVFQSQKINTVGHWGKDMAAKPGFGRHSDLWLMNVDTKQFYQLTHTADNEHSGVLHPHFSHDGKQLTWGDMYKKPNLFKKAGGAGFWNLKVADFSFQDGKPSLTNIRSYDPGSNPGWHENHGLSPDGRKLLFTSNFEGSGAMTSNIYQYDIVQKQLLRMTFEKYNEHALYVPNTQRILWMTSSENPNRGTDYWTMNLDGSDKRRMTDFNNPDLPTFNRKMIIAADSSLNPDGTKLVAYLQTDLITQDGLIVMIEFR